jgi:hypothetical protein
MLQPAVKPDNLLDDRALGVGAMEVPLGMSLRNKELQLQMCIGVFLLTHSAVYTATQ